MLECCTTKAAVSGDRFANNSTCHLQAYLYKPAEIVVRAAEPQKPMS